MSTVPAYETESPLGDIDINALDILYNTLPDDLTRPKLEEIVRINRILRARRIEAEASGPKPRAKKAAAESGEPKAPRVTKAKAAQTTVEVSTEPQEDMGF